VRSTAMNRAQRGKLALTAAALGASLLTAGCGYITPQQTSHQYSASDGIRADLGPLQLRNILIVSKGENEPGRLIGAVYNSSSKDVKLTVNGAKGSQTEVPVKANGYTLLNQDSDAAVLSTTGGKPGSLVELKVSENGTNVSNTVKVPVLDATLKEYKDYVPTPSASETSSSSASPSASSSAGSSSSARSSASATPSATASATATSR
jgi:predicted nuclease of predicted toxin-antitoxin system